MAQFDVFRTRGAGVYPFVIDVQADIHARLATRIVVPVVSRTRYTQPATRLNPIVTVLGEAYVVVSALIAAVPTVSLGSAVASVAAQRETLIAALDLLITGS
jgi:toxin CcdB